jgi:hypothetical protein
MVMTQPMRGRKRLRFSGASSGASSGTGAVRVSVAGPSLSISINATWAGAGKGPARGYSGPRGDGVDPGRTHGGHLVVCACHSSGATPNRSL